MLPVIRAERVNASEIHEVQRSTCKDIRRVNVHNFPEQGTTLIRSARDDIADSETVQDSCARNSHS
jgi:hypothetical protein